jgi:hypothetical protein
MNENGKTMRKRRGSGPQQQKLFTAFKQGWSIHATPNNAAGWKAMALWMGSLLIPLLPFMWAISQPWGETYAALIVLFLLGATIYGWSCSFAMYWKIQILSISIKRNKSHIIAF